MPLAPVRPYRQVPFHVISEQCEARELRSTHQSKWGRFPAMRWLAAVFLALLASGCGSDEPGARPMPDGSVASCSGLADLARTDRYLELSSDGVVRNYYVYVPASYQPTQATPLVLSFHGLSSNASQQRLLDGLTALASDFGFIVVHPEGTGAAQSWNAGECCGEAQMSGIDDVRFVDELLDQLSTELCIDASRIYSTGMSNGGFMSYRLACELGDRIAAIAPVAGGVAVQPCLPGRPIPVLHFHGTADTLVPYLGLPAMGLPPVTELVESWAASNDCNRDPTTTYDTGDATCISYEGCQADATTTLCTIETGGHTWPGSDLALPFGKTSEDFAATE